MRQEKTSRPASSSRSCWAITMPLPSPTGVLAHDGHPPAQQLAGRRIAHPAKRVDADPLGLRPGVGRGGVQLRPDGVDHGVRRALVGVPVRREASDEGPQGLPRQRARRRARRPGRSRCRRRARAWGAPSVARFAPGARFVRRKERGGPPKSSRAAQGEPAGSATFLCRAQAPISPAHEPASRHRALPSRSVLASPRPPSRRSALLRTPTFAWLRTRRRPRPARPCGSAVVLDQDAGWHTYWRNPGDAGEATQIAWTLPAGWQAGDIVWPVPRRLPLGPIMNYGYEGRAVLPVPISIPARREAGLAGAPDGQGRLSDLRRDLRSRRGGRATRSPGGRRSRSRWIRRATP